MHYIDLVNNNARLTLPQVNRLPRIKGRTQITTETHPDALTHYSLAREVRTEPANPDNVLQDPQQVDGVWTTVWAPRVYTLDDKKAAIKQRRDQAIYAGIVVEGLPIDTDEVTQGRLAGAALAAVIDDTYTANWKVSGQFVTLTAQQIIGIAQAVRSHVQACFNREAELLSLTDESGDPREPTLDEIAEGWSA